VPRLLIATNNPDKLAEIAELLSGLGVELLSLRDFPQLASTVEDRDTLRGNAAKRALEAAQQTGLLCLADDTGLFIRALNDEPGVFAARYAGEHCSYKDNRDKVLRLLAGITDRRAEFRTCAVLAAPDGIVAIKEGIMPGRIASSERGSNGFGYDPLFLLPELGRTMAELTREEKNTLSHRGGAMRHLLARLAAHPL